MGLFRKHKKSDHSADECRRNCNRLLREMAAESDVQQIEQLSQQWAEYRELLARHEDQNASDID